MSGRVLDQGMLEQAIEALVRDFEQLHGCEVSSIWVEHSTEAPGLEVTITTHERVKVA